MRIMNLPGFGAIEIRSQREEPCRRSPSSAPSSEALCLALTVPCINRKEISPVSGICGSCYGGNGPR